jgi:hypothetical protein
MIREPVAGATLRACLRVLGDTRKLDSSQTAALRTRVWTGTRGSAGALSDFGDGVFYRKMARRKRLINLNTDAITSIVAIEHMAVDDFSENENTLIDNDHGCARADPFRREYCHSLRGEIDDPPLHLLFT